MNGILQIALVTGVLTFLAATSLQAQEAGVPRVVTFPGIEKPAFSYARPEAVGLSAEALSGLGDEIVDWVSKDLIVGAEVLIIKDGYAVFHESYGWSDRESERRMERGSIFRMRSMTKPVLGTAVLMLVEEGRLSLDDAAAKYLPSFDTDQSRSITVRQLLTHTSGLGDHGTADIGLAQPPAEYASLRALADAIGTIGVTGVPGSFHYSDSGSATLGAIVADVSGMPLERFIEVRILEPLRMADTHTRFTPDAPWASRMNSTYRRSRERCGFERYWDPSEAQHYPYFRASGGLYSTTMDYARFMTMWMNKGRYGDVRLLSEETVEAAVSPYASEGHHSYGMHWTIQNPSIKNGLPAAFGHMGSDGTLAIAMPELNALALYFTQSRGSASRERFLFQLEQLPPFDEHVISHWGRDIEAQWAALHGEPSGSDSTVSAPAVEPTKQLEQYAGTYTLGGAEHILSVDDLGLRSSFPRTPEGSLLHKASDGVFLTQDPCTGLLYRLTFDARKENIYGYRLESSNGRSATFEKQH